MAVLKYPEGTACAEVLKAGANRGVARGSGPGGHRQHRRQHQRAHHLHRLRHRSCLQGAERRLQGLARCARHHVRRAAQGRLDCGGSLAGTARRRLHHRSACRRDDVRGRLHDLSAADSDDPVLRIDGARHPGARHDAHRRHGPGRRARCLRPLHRRGRRGRCRHHQPDSLAAADRRQHPAWHRRCLGRAQRQGQHRPPRARPVDEVRRHRHHSCCSR